MARGIPLIAANVGGLPDFVHDGKNGMLFDPADADALARAYDRLAALPAEGLARLTSAARATAESYSWPKIVSRLMRIYSECRNGA